MSESLQEKSTSESESVQKSVKVKKEPGQDIQSETERKYFDIFLPQNQHKVEEDGDLSDELIPVLIRQSEIRKHCLLDRFVKTDCGEGALITVNKDVGTPQYKPLTTRLVIFSTSKICRVLGNIPSQVSDQCVKYTSEDDVESMSPNSRRRYRDAMHQRRRWKELVANDKTKAE